MVPEVERFSKWLRRRSPHASTHIHYASDLELFLTWLGKPLTQVVVTDMDRFIEHSQAQGHANATINRRLAAIHSLYHFLSFESDSAPRNPVMPKRHMIRQGRRLPRDVEDAVLEKLFASITFPRDRCMFLLMLRCGLRVGEIRNLSLDDVLLRTTRGNLPRLRVCGKNSTERIVYLSAQAQSALRSWLAVRSKSQDDALFLNRFGCRLSVTGIQDRLARYCHLAGTWVTCHQLRHTFGRHLAEARVPVTTIQRLFGHARLRTTELYIHLSDPDVQASYEAAMVEITRRLPLDGGAP
jgi:site-specific recombinase XerD